MLKKRITLLALTILLSLAWVNNVFAKEVHIKVAGRADSTHEYFHDLLRSSLKLSGYEPSIEIINDLPQKRANQLFERGDLDLTWWVESNARNNRFLPVEFNITNNLLGQRILLIPKGKASEYANVHTLKDFKALNKFGALGVDWFDVDVWKLNDLKYYTVDGEWRRIFTMLASGKHNIDYFSRGAIEIIAEAKLHQELDVEPRLILSYDRDFRFYFTKENRNLKNIIEVALQKAGKTGLVDHLLQKHFGSIFTRLNMRDRTVLNLRTPK